MRRACDALVDRFVTTPPDPATRTLLRLGAYQLAFAGVPAHAAVGETVALAPNRVARLRERRAAQGGDDADGVAVGVGAPELPRLDRRHCSSPSSAPSDAHDAMERMNEPATVHDASPTATCRTSRRNGSRPRSRRRPGELVLDACAAPGGKATATRRGRRHVSRRPTCAPHRAVVWLPPTPARLGADVATVVADATRPPFADGVFDAVLIDAPCSGLGALRRRPDARWRIQPDDVDDLAALQRRMLESSRCAGAPGRPA